MDEIDQCLEKESDDNHISNLKWLRANLEFTQLLDKVGKRLEPAWQLRDEGRTGELSSLNQRVWGEYQMLQTFLKNGLEQSGE